MNECEGYLTPEGECLEAVSPINTLPADCESGSWNEQGQCVVVPSTDELAATGFGGPDPLLAVGAALFVSLGWGMLRDRHRRIR